MLTTIDRFAYLSKLKDISPEEKLLFAFLTLIICLSSNSLTVFLAISFIMLGVSVIGGGIPLGIYIRIMLVPLAFLLMSVLTIALEVGNAATVFMVSFNISNFTLGITESSFKTAAMLFFKAFGAVSCLYFLSLNTPLVDLISTLRKLKLPQIILELMELIYRFIFVLFETAQIIYTSQLSRLGYQDLSTAYRSLGQLISVLFLKSYKYSSDLYTALEARGYEGTLRVVSKKHKVSIFNVFMIILVEIFLLVLVLWSGGNY